MQQGIAVDKKTQVKQKANWFLSIIFFFLVFQTLPWILGFVGYQAARLGIPRPVIPVLGLLLGICLFFTAAKYYIALRLPKHVEHEVIPLHEVLQQANEVGSAAPQAPLPLPTGDSGVQLAVPGLDVAGFIRYSQSLEALGFVHQFDWRRVDKNAVIDTVYNRTFWHPQYHCIAQLTQIMPLGAASVGVRCSIASFFDNEYEFNVTDRAPDVMSYLLRMPQALWMRRPETDVAGLLRLHLARRAWLEQAMGSTSIKTFSQPNLMARFERGYEAFRRTLRRKNVLVGLIEAIGCKVKPRREWWGKYSGQVPPETAETQPAASLT